MQKISTLESNYLERLIEDIKSISTQEISDSPENESPNVRVLEPQRVFYWIRIYLKEEIDLVEGDYFKMEYLPSGENMTIKFITYGKKNIHKDQGDQIINYDPEVDKKHLCLIIDENEVNTRGDIPFIRTLFKISKFYEFQVIRRTDLVFTNIRTGVSPEYVDCDF